ncbi:MAG: beta-propeller domain-containing protein [Archaeoglobaceae archaeon]|nr:beta-propeller domain-containing protein [Archaeoglobaceae archaeon]MDW7989912.1 beta-propeller domain-containing protein [Archaeoglobaceae archaeon]
MIVGELKIPGYSSYLHPLNEDLILGIGMEDWNVKISLFNVSDP